MKALLKYEFRRVLCDKKNLYFFAIFLLVAIYFVNSGLNEFNRFQKDKAVFIKYEKARIKGYSNYQQYSGYGFRVLFEPSPLNIFFNNSTVLFDIEGNVDNTQILKIYNFFKGRRLFYSRGYFKDFSGFIYFIGSLLMIYMGILNFRSIDWLKFKLQFISFRKLFIMSTFIRLVYLNLFFILVMVIVFAYAGLNKLSFSGDEIYLFISFGLFTLLMLNFFYFVGLLLAILLKLKKAAFIWMFIFWLAFTLLVPEINRLYLFENVKELPPNEDIDSEKTKLLMQFQYNVMQRIRSIKDNKKELIELYKKSVKEYLENYHLHIKNKETLLSKKIRNTIHYYEKNTLLFPTMFYSFLSAEISSKGYYGYLDFKNHMVETQEAFLRFFLNKRYILDEKEVESFVKKDENIFKAIGHFPQSFWQGFGITFFYCFLLLAAAYILLKRRIYPNV